MIHITHIIISDKGIEEKREVSITIDAKQLETLREEYSIFHEGKKIYFIYKHF